MRVLEAPVRSRRTHAAIRGALVGIRQEYGAQAHGAGAVRQPCHRAAQAGLSWSRVAEQLNAWRTPTGQGGARWYASTARKLALRDEPDRCPMCGSPLLTPSGDNRGTRLEIVKE